MSASRPREPQATDPANPPPALPKPRRRPFWTPERVALLAGLADEAVTADELANVLDSHVTAIHAAAARHGIRVWGRHWTPAEDADLRRHLDEDPFRSCQRAAIRTGRPAASCAARARRLGIPVGPPGGPPRRRPPRFVPSPAIPEPLRATRGHNTAFDD